MQPTPGSRIGPYEVEIAIGAGGMGEVYRARDTRLNRQVAIKSLPAAFAQDPERVARFRREAQLLAALNHPNIAGIYGLEDIDGSLYLVLEFVDGQTLADRIAKGPMPLTEALPIAREVSDALEAAHEKGIIHRDLKPANVAISSEGKVKVLDFGLARYESGEAGTAVDISASPTLAYAATQSGVILGTAAYMSPEQARGRTVDKRTDVWAFGCLLYEMLTGKKAFEGEDVSDTLAAILRSDPDWSLLPANVPPAVRSIIQRCLDRDRRTRIPDLSVVRYLVADSSSSMAAATDPGASAIAPAPTPRSARVPWLVAGLCATALVAVTLLWAPWRRPVQPPVVRLSVDIGADAGLTQGLPIVALSPDGSTLAFTALRGQTSQLYIRRLTDLRATLVEGSDGAGDPFFSPDGQWVAFFAGSSLKKVATVGGAVVTLCDVPGARGGWWGDDGNIVYQAVPDPGQPLMKVSGAGGTPTPAMTTKNEGMARWPQVLPGSRAVIYMATGSAITSYENASIVALSLPDGTPKVLVQNAYYPRYSATGHLLYIQNGTVFAAPFDPDRLELTGPAVPAVEKVLSATGNGSASFAISDNGTLAFVSGTTLSVAGPILWLDQSGKTTELRSTPSDWTSPAFSPDGSRLALDIADGNQTDIWTYDWVRDTLTRLTFDRSTDSRPFWTPDGQRIGFASTRGKSGVQNLFWQKADGTGEAQQLTTANNVQYGGSFHPNGKVLAFTELRPGTGQDVMILPIEGDEASGWKPGTPSAFLSAPYTEGSPQFSPDGKWLAYISNETGRNEIYVRPYPGPGGKWQISEGGGDDPTWSPTAHELFFLSSADFRLMRVPYSDDGGSFGAGKPEAWSDAVIAGRPRPPSRDLDLHPDGKRFVVGPKAATNDVRVDRIVLTFNYADELRRLAAPK